MLRSKITFDSFVRGLIVIAAFVAVILLIRYLSSVLIPFVIALLTAYILRPIVRYIERSRILFCLEYLFERIRHRFECPHPWHRSDTNIDADGKPVYPECSRFRRIPAVLTTLILFVALIVAFCMLLIPPMVSQGEHLSRLVTSYVQNELNNSMMPDFIGEQLHALLASIDVRTLLMDANVIDVAKNILQGTWNVVSQGFGMAVGLVTSLISVLYLFFIMIDYEKESERILNLIPQGNGLYKDKANYILKKVENNMSKYFQSQALIAFIVGILFAIGFSIIDLPMAIGLGLFIGLLNMVPYLQVIGVVPAVLFAVLQALKDGNDVVLALVAVGIVFLVVQTIQDAILTPKIMGTKFDMSPTVILLSLSVWGSLLGFIGLVIAIPLADLVRQAYDVLVLNKEKIPL
ncbi:MAG: AI-2E family transporter [Bacteroidales bacterium]|nr:AI-2E family transporter [Bacteroidales bacterium]